MLIEESKDAWSLEELFPHMQILISEVAKAQRAWVDQLQIEAPDVPTCPAAIVVFYAMAIRLSADFERLAPDTDLEQLRQWGVRLADGMRTTQRRRSMT